MVVFPNCKINLGLSVLNRRADNYHDLETVFYPIRLNEVLEVVTGTETQFELSGTDLQLAPGNNLCLRAYELLRREFSHLPPVRIHLHKIIPAGAGLGGGSADAAFMLLLLNEKYRLGLTIDALQRYALELGSDCPFFIINKPCLARGRGEIFHPVDVDLSAYQLLLINPGIHVNTGQAFSMITPHAREQSPDAIMRLPVTQWKGRLINDFEDPVTAMHPVIGQIRDQLYDAGAVYAAMSGSGSTVFGIFPGEAVMPVDQPPDYFVRVIPGQAAS